MAEIMEVVLESGVEQDEKEIKHMLETYKPNQSPEYCIYRIPDNIRTLNAAAYTPRFVSIGPIHYNNPSFHTMEIQKVGYLQSFLKRTEINLKDFIAYIAECEAKVRSCYAQNNFQVYNFRIMLLMDGIFVIEYFLMVRNCAKNLKQMEGKPLNIESDLILLENQLPFFLLNGLYHLAFPSNGIAGGLPSFLELACYYFSQYNYIGKPPNEVVEHFTDLLRKSHQPPPWSLESDIFEQVHWSKSATVLYEAGVKFKVGSTESLCNIQFKDGVLEIPCFSFKSSTESFARNLMALEQCQYLNEPYMCYYFYFMDNLINTSKDVDLLVKKGIIINRLGSSDAVANLVNKLSRNVVVVNAGFYAKICKELNEHCNVRCHRWMVDLKRDYLSTPWKFAATSTVVLLLLLTLVQTVCAIISLTSGKKA